MAWLFIVPIFYQLTSEKNQVHTCNLTHCRQTLQLIKFYLIKNMKGNGGNYLAQFKFPFIGFLDSARSGCELSARFKTFKMKNKHDSSIQSHDCYLKRCFKNSLTQYSFYVMEARVSSNCTRDIHRTTPEKEINQKENSVGKIAQRWQIRKCTHAQIPILTKFYSIM